VIVSVHNDRHFRDEYILPIRRVPTEAQFLERAKVLPDSYAGRLISKLYYRLFSISLELKRDYSTFYEVEYPTFEQYLRKRHLLNKEDASELNARYAKAAAIIRFGRLYTFMEEGAGADLLAKLLDLED
jgi:hypothetical protein